MSCSMTDNLLPQDRADTLTHGLQKIGTSTTVRGYDFHSLTGKLKTNRFLYRSGTRLKLARSTNVSSLSDGLFGGF